jgi:hypothetical protein
MAARLMETQRQVGDNLITVRYIVNNSYEIPPVQYLRSIDIWTRSQYSC